MSTDCLGWAGTKIKIHLFGAGIQNYRVRVEILDLPIGFKTLDHLDSESLNDQNSVFNIN